MKFGYGTSRRACGACLFASFLSSLGWSSEAKSGGGGAEGRSRRRLVTSVKDLDTGGLNVSDLVETLVGSGPQSPIVSNVTFKGNLKAAGTFSGGTNTSIGIEDGVVLSSGCAKKAIGPNLLDNTTCIHGEAGDEDLDKLAGNCISTFDAAVLEFDLECPDEDTISFTFVFGSEEYNEFTCQFNDVFGFLLNGVNIATVPFTADLPVAINNVNKNNNSDFYNNNDPDDFNATNPIPFNVEADGFTVILEAVGSLQPGKNRLKFVIGDKGNSASDSWVFLESSGLVCGRDLEEEFFDTFEFEVEGDSFCGSQDQVNFKERIEAAIQSYSDQEFKCLNSGKNVSSVNLVEFEEKLECDNITRRLEETAGHHVSRNLARKRRKSQGKGNRKGNCNGCKKRRNRRLQESFVIDLGIEDAGKALHARRAQTACEPTDLPDLAEEFREVGFQDAANATLETTFATCEIKDSEDCLTGGACCGSAGCSCSNIPPSTSLCASEGCCLRDADPFDPDFCKNVGSCGPKPCDGGQGPRQKPVVVPCPQLFDECDHAPGSNCCLPGNKWKKPKYTLSAGDKLKRGEWMCRRYAFGLLSSTGTAHLLQPIYHDDGMCEVIWTAENYHEEDPPKGHELELRHDGHLVLRDQVQGDQWDVPGCGHGWYKPKLKMSRLRDVKGSTAKVIYLFTTSKSSHRMLGGNTGRQGGLPASLGRRRQARGLDARRPNDGGRRARWSAGGRAQRGRRRRHKKKKNSKKKSKTKIKTKKKSKTKIKTKKSKTKSKTKKKSKSTMVEPKRRRRRRRVNPPGDPFRRQIWSVTWWLNKAGDEVENCH